MFEGVFINIEQIHLGHCARDMKQSTMHFSISINYVTHDINNFTCRKHREDPFIK